jgi:hypothetical protein
MNIQKVYLPTLLMNQSEKGLTNSLESRIPIQNNFNRLKPTKIQLHKYKMGEA